MIELIDDRTIAISLLKIFPELVREDVLEDEAFRKRYDLAFDATINFKTINLSIKRSELYPAIRKLYGKAKDTISISTVDGATVSLTMDLVDDPKVFLSVGDKRHEIPSFGMLAEDKSTRIAFFQDEIANQNLPTDLIAAWRQKLEAGPLEDEAIDDLHLELALVPQTVAGQIQEEFQKPEGTVSVIVPRNPTYYRALIGDRGEAGNIEEYVAGNAKAHIERLLNWDFKRGLAQCLLFCASPRISALVDISGKPAEDVEKFFAWLADRGDLFSQTAGVEIGIRALAEYPAIEPHLLRIIEQIRDDSPSDKQGRLNLTTNVFVFADGELARIRIFANAPPFWRRMAAIAQASMIERMILDHQAASEDWSQLVQMRAQQFFMQTLTDLRIEPRWLPDLLSPSQLRLEFLVRARIAGNECKDKLPDGPLRSLLLGKEPNQLESITSVPSAYAAGPLEGGVASSQDFPADLLAELRKPTDEKVLEAKIFASVVNFSLTFRFDTEIASHIADLLRKVQYRLALTQGDDISFTLIMGLAAIAASARHTGLADEIRILTRVLIRRGDLTADAESQMRIAMVTCASREKRDEWCKAVGDWLLEIANGKLARKEAARLRSDIHVFCHAVPDLWPHIAKIDAALALVSE